MLDKTDDISVGADNWLAQFETALAEPDDGPAEGAVSPRQLLARCAGAELEPADRQRRRRDPHELKTHAPAAARPALQIDPDRAAPRRVTRAGTHAIEAIFKFETAQGRGNGILRLIPDAATATG